ncbi:MAG: hypothetical protein L0Z50_05075, partial [Verrucomicrobiales bacterium]|nr:hypothetical protein [Verrucomicrobiales bacterium]
MDWLRTEAEKKAKVDEAAAKTDPAPTDAQIEAENYTKGKVTLDGMTISIETAKGETRRSKPGQPPWEVVMPSHYGQILGTKAADGDLLDIYVGDNPESPVVYVIDQINPETGEFDELKLLYAFQNEAQAVAAYDGAFSDGSGPSRRGAVTEISKDQLKEFIDSGKTDKPLSYSRREVVPDAEQEEEGQGQEVLTPAPNLAAGIRVESPVAQAAAAVPLSPSEPLPAAPAPISAPVQPTPIDPITLVDTESRGPFGGPFLRVIPEGSTVETLKKLLQEHARAQRRQMHDYRNEINYQTKQSSTSQVTFFLDTDTGEVTGIGTYLMGETRVGKHPALPAGTTLKKFIEGTSGRRNIRKGRFVPLATMRVNTPVEATDERSAIRFQNREAFAAFLAEAQERVSSAREALGLSGAAEVARKRGRQPGVSTLALAAERRAEAKPEELATRETPADIVAASEGFSAEDAAAIFNAIKEVRLTRIDSETMDARSRQALIDALKTSPEAKEPLLRMLDILGPLNDYDKDSTSYMMLEWIYDAKKIAKAQAKTTVLAEKVFSATLTSELNKARRDSARRIRDQVSAETAATSTTGSSAGGVTRTEPGPTSPGGTRPASTPAQQAQVKRHTPPLRFTAPHGITARWLSTLEALARAGVDTTLVQQAAAGLGAEFAQYNRGAQTVTLAMANLAEPSADNLYVLTAEAVHAAFAGLPTDLQARLQNAVRAVTDEMLGIGAGRSSELAAPYSADQRESVLQEERLVDATTRHIVAEGFNPAEARGLAQSFWRFLKQLLLRASWWVHRAWNGGQDSPASSKIAQQYFDTRVKSWLAGDWRPLSFVDFMGGGRPSATEKAAIHPNANGLNAITYRWNPDTFEFEYQEADPATVTGARFNLENAVIRFHRPQSVNEARQPGPDTSPAIVLPDFAAWNYVGDSLGAIYGRWTSLGNNRTSTGAPLLDPAGFMPWALEGTRMDNPAELVAAQNATLERLGQPPQNPHTRIGDMNPDVQRDVAARAYHMLGKIKARWEARRLEADEAWSGRFSSIKAQMERAARRVVNLTLKNTDADLMFSEALDWMNAQLAFLKQNGKRIGETSHTTGVLEQVIQGIENQLSEPLAHQYATAMDRVIRKLATDVNSRTSFVVMLQQLGALDMPWGEMTLGEIKDLLRATDLSVLQAPDLDLIQADTQEGKALLGIVAAFLKANNLWLDSVTIRAEVADQERETVNDMLKTALSDQVNSIAIARSQLGKLARLKAKATRLLAQLEQAKKDQDALMDKLVKAQNFQAFHNDALPLLQAQLAELERTMGATPVVFEAFPGSAYRVPEQPSDPPEAWTEKAYQHTRNGTLDAAMHEDLRKISEWLDAHPAGDPLHGGAAYRALELQLAKMRDNDIQATENKNRRVYGQKYAGSIPQFFEDTGDPNLKSAARRMRNWLSWNFTHSNDTVGLALEFSNAERAAMKAVGWKKYALQSAFRQEWIKPALDLFRRRSYTLASVADAPAAVEQVFSELRELYLSRGVSNDQWKALRAAIQAWGDGAAFFGNIARETGVLVRDDVLGLFRQLRGAPLFEVMQRMSSGISETTKGMLEGAWRDNPLDISHMEGEGGTNAQRMQAAYEANPEAFAATMRPLFSGDVWENFVRPMAYDVVSKFHAPADASGFMLLAKAENVQRAFDAAAPGDVVGFARALYALEGGTPATSATPEGAFVAETLSTFNNYWRSLRGVVAEQSNIAKGYGVESPNELLMNSRDSDSWPGEWVDYRPYDLLNAHTILHTILHHAAFGRNIAGLDRDIEQGKRHFEELGEVLTNIEKTVQGEFGHRPQRYIREMIQRRVEAYDWQARFPQGTRAYGYQELKLARDKTTKNIDQMQSWLKAWIQAGGGVTMDFRSWAELIRTATAAAVQGYKAALIDIQSLYKPIEVYGLSVASIRASLRAQKQFVKTVALSLWQIFSRQLHIESEHMKKAAEFGIYDPATQHTLKERVIGAFMSYPLAPGASFLDHARRYAAITGRAGRQIISTGIPARGEAVAPTFKPTAPFTYATQAMLPSATMASWRMFEDMVMDAARWMTDTHEGRVAALDPNFRFTKDHAEALGYRPRLFNLLDDAKSFEYMLAKLNQYGTSLEQLTKEWFARGRTGPVFSDEAFRKLLPIAGAEIMQEETIASRPGWMMSSPGAQTWMKLLGWALTQTGAVTRSFYPTYDSEQNTEFKKGLKSLTALMGVAIAFVLLRDWWEEEILRKKPNRAELLAKQSPQDMAKALVDAADVSGRFGLAGSAVNSFVNVSTQRDFSVDNRVFMLSMMKNLWNTGRNWVHSGLAATYASTARPIIQAFGGSGFLEQVQILNTGLDFANEIGLDFEIEGVPVLGAEARVVKRINANNWLRVAGRKLGMDVRIPKGDPVLPNRTTPHVNAMIMAALGNDSRDFSESYRDARMAARKEGEIDPEDYVKRRYADRHPLKSLFQTRPTQAE